METISFMIEKNIADIIKDEAGKNYTTVSQYMRKLVTELNKEGKLYTKYEEKKE